MCKVPGCLSGTRSTQEVCDCCRKKFIRDKKFRERLLAIGVIPD